MGIPESQKTKNGNWLANHFYLTHARPNGKGCFRCVIKLLMLKTETDSVVSHFITLGRNFIDIF